METPRNIRLIKFYITVIAFLITNLSFAQNEKLDPNYVPIESPEFNRLMEHMKKKPVVFTINNAADTVLELPSGTKLTIPQNAFTNSNGEIIKGELNISFNEFISVADMMAEGLATIDSNGKTLESGGMFHIKATDKNGEELKLNPTSSITIDLMSDAKAKPYNLYSSQTGKNWQLQKSDHLYVLPLLYFYSPYTTKNGLRYVFLSQSLKYDALFGGNLHYYMYQPYKLGYPFPDNFPFVFNNNAINFLDFVLPKQSDKNKAIKIITNKEKLVTNFKVLKKKYKNADGFDSVNIEIIGKNNQYNTNILADNLELMINRSLSEGWCCKEKENFIIRVITYSTPILPSTEALLKLGNEMSNYTFSIKSLSYKNLDKLLDDKSPRVSIKVQHNSIDLLGTCYLTFRNRKVLINKSLQSNMNFSQIIKDEPCKVVAYGLQNGKIMYAETDFVADSDKSISLNFQELNSEEVLKDKIIGI